MEKGEIRTRHFCMTSCHLVFKLPVGAFDGPMNSSGCYHAVHWGSCNPTTKDEGIPLHELYATKASGTHESCHSSPLATVMEKGLSSVCRQAVLFIRTLTWWGVLEINLGRS